MTSQTIIVALPSDIHCNSVVGTLPRKIELDKKLHVNNKTQNWIRDCWDDSLERIWKLKKQHRAKLIICVVGEGPDKNKHDPNELISQNVADVIKMSVEVLSRPRDMSDDFIMIRGTEAHEGPDSYLTELLAGQLEATPSVIGTHSWYYWLARLGGQLIDAAHHSQTGGIRPWTEQAAASRQSEITYYRKSKLGWQVPNISVRAHRHYAADSGIYTWPRTFYTRPWQLLTNFGQRIGSPEASRALGTLVLIIKDETVTPIDLKYPPPETPIWEPEWK